MNVRRSARWLPYAFVFAGAPAFAQDASQSDAARAVTDAGGDGATTAPATLRSADGRCEYDPVPAGHEVRIETLVLPPAPTVGDRVVIRYRLYSHGADRLQFEPDPIAFSLPDLELEYAREQPDRDRSIHTAANGLVYGEVAIAVQPFKTGEVTIASQLAHLNAAGDVIRVCTPPVRFRVRDPFGNDPHPVPHDTTPPEVVSEDALRFRWIALAADGLFGAVVVTLALSAYVRSRPKPVKPPPPPRPPWIVAIEALDAIGASDLLSRGQTKDYFDAVSDVVRRYVGGYRGFDALEMTTDEVLRRLRRTPLPGIAPAEIEHLLRECDLVKFARYVPTHEESEKILESAYSIVRRSMPVAPTGGPAKPTTTEGV